MARLLMVSGPINAEVRNFLGALLNNLIAGSGAPFSDSTVVPEAFEVEPQDLRKLVDHQLLPSFRQQDRLGRSPPAGSCRQNRYDRVDARCLSGGERQTGFTMQRRAAGAAFCSPLQWSQA